jgi:hypothetical protein
MVALILRTEFASESSSHVQKVPESSEPRERCGGLRFCSRQNWKLNTLPVSRSIRLSSRQLDSVGFWSIHKGYNAVS